MLLLEIWLTVLVWKKGWKGFALLPLGVGSTLAFLMGIMITLGGGSVERLGYVPILFDIASIVALIMMLNHEARLSKPAQTRMVITPTKQEHSQIETFPVPHPIP